MKWNARQVITVVRLIWFGRGPLTTVYAITIPPAGLLIFSDKKKMLTTLELPEKFKSDIVMSISRDPRKNRKSLKRTTILLSTFRKSLHEILLHAKVKHIWSRKTRCETFFIFCSLFKWNHFVLHKPPPSTAWFEVVEIVWIDTIFKCFIFSCCNDVTLVTRTTLFDLFFWLYSS